MIKLMELPKLPLLVPFMIRREEASSWTSKSTGYQHSMFFCFIKSLETLKANQWNRQQVLPRRTLFGVTSWRESNLQQITGRLRFMLFSLNWSIREGVDVGNQGHLEELPALFPNSWPDE